MLKECHWETGKRFVFQSPWRQHCSQHSSGIFESGNNVDLRLLSLWINNPKIPIILKKNMIGMYTLNMYSLSEFDPLGSLVITILEFYVCLISCAFSPSRLLKTHYCHTTRFNSSESSVGTKLQALSSSTLFSLSAWVYLECQVQWMCNGI